MQQQFDYKGVTATPMVLNPDSEQDPDLRIVRGWKLAKDSEQITCPSSLRTPEEVRKWIDQNVTGTA